MEIINSCVSDYKYLGIVCNCGEGIEFNHEATIWNNPVITCKCGVKYLPFMNGFAYPVIYINKTWIKYTGTVVLRKD